MCAASSSGVTEYQLSASNRTPRSNFEKSSRRLNQKASRLGLKGGLTLPRFVKMPFHGSTCSSRSDGSDGSGGSEGSEGSRDSSVAGTGVPSSEKRRCVGMTLRGRC